jgi:hypothetical protein
MSVVLEVKIVLERKIAAIRVAGMKCVTVCDVNVVWYNAVGSSDQRYKPVEYWKDENNGLDIKVFIRSECLLA